MIDLYDHEILEVEKVMEALGKRIGEMGPMAETFDSFCREAEERFAEIGLDAQVAMLPEPTDPRIHSPHITINGRIDKKHEFDHDRQVHEVTSDILGIADGGGVIKTQSGLILPGQ